MIAQYLKKGQLIYAEGTPEAEGYLNKDNQNAASLKLRVFQVQLLGSSKTDSGNSQPNNAYQNQANSNVNQPDVSTVEEAADDLPF